jgi:hypothetical protein
MVPQYHKGLSSVRRIHNVTIFLDSDAVQSNTKHTAFASCMHMTLTHINWSSFKISLCVFILCSSWISPLHLFEFKCRLRTCHWPGIFKLWLRDETKRFL